MKLSEEVDPRLEVVANEPRLDVREPRLLPDEQDRVLADRLQETWKTWKKGEVVTSLRLKTKNYRRDQLDPLPPVK